jgi:hypothetical protein
MRTVIFWTAANSAHFFWGASASLVQSTVRPTTVVLVPGTTGVFIRTPFRIPTIVNHAATSQSIDPYLFFQSSQKQVGRICVFNTFVSSTSSCIFSIHHFIQYHPRTRFPLSLITDLNPWTDLDKTNILTVSCDFNRLLFFIENSPMTSKNNVPKPGWPWSTSRISKTRGKCLTFHHGQLSAMEQCISQKL